MINTDLIRAIVAKNLFVKNLFWPFLKIIPNKFLYGKTFFKIIDMINKNQCNNKFIENWIESNLNRLIVKSLKVNFYKNSFKNISKIKDNLFKSKNSNLIKMFPITNKSVLKNSMNDFIVGDESSYDLCTTGGTSGKPLGFYLEKNRSPKEWAFINNFWSKSGYRIGEWRMVFRGVSSLGNNTWYIDNFLNEIYVSPFSLNEASMNDFYKLIIKYKVNYLHGYPSAIYIFSKYLLNKTHINLNDIDIKGVFLVSEKVENFQKNIIQKCFKKAKILSFYGLSEKVLFAEEKNNVYEFNPFYGYAELIDNSGNLITKKNTRGRIIGTGFLFDGTLFIRYDTGDTAELIELPSKNNYYRLRVKNIHPRRSQEFLVGKNNELISMTAINLHSVSFLLIKEFQFFQLKKGYVTFKYVTDLSNLDIDQLILELENKIGGSVHFKTQRVKTIKRTKIGKFKYIDQRLKFEF